jgi:hypothetical protein
VLIRQEGDLRGFACPGGVQVGWGVSEVREAFVTILEGMYRRHDESARQLLLPQFPESDHGPMGESGI